MKSLGQKIQQLEGLIGHADATPWEHGFIESISQRSKSGADTTSLSEKQVETAEKIWAKHFA